MKVLLWNIWIDGYFDKITDYIKNANADIIGLQEVLENDPKRNIIGFLEKLDYQHVYAPVKKIWGNEVWSDGPAIFSKHEIINSQTYSLSKTDTRAAVRADIKIEDKIIHVFSTHLIHTHQMESEIQQEQVKTLLGVLTPEKTILMGDFNAIPESETIKLIKNVMEDTDSSSRSTWSVYPEGCITCKPEGINIRLDYIFISRDLLVKSFEVGKSDASDHLPITAVIELK